MNEALEILRARLGKRSWNMVVIRFNVSPEDLEALLQHYRDDADLFLIFEPDESLRRDGTACCGRRR